MVNQENILIWEEIGQQWPDPIQLRHVKHLDGFPYSSGYFRNLATGNNPDHELKKDIFRIGKFPAIRKHCLIRWLALRTV